MTNPLRITFAQLNFKVGDLESNLNKMLQAAITARDEQQADLIVFPELCLTGYPPEDLLLREQFIEEAEIALKKFIKEIHGIYCLVGHPHRSTEGLHNACSLIYNQQVIAQYAKQILPNYGVFDEHRYFVPGKTTCVVTIKDLPVGLLICEDLWQAKPMAKTIAQGAKLIIVPNASPFEVNKHEERIKLLSLRAQTHQVPIVYVNQIGGQDELVFDGGSVFINSQGTITHFSGFFKENISTVSVDTANSPNLNSASSVIPSQLARTYDCLVLSVRDYVEKNHLPGVLIGVSGGIDSALTLAIAVDALGKERVKALILPSRYTSALSMEEAIAVSQGLAVEYTIISIEKSYQAFLDSLNMQSEADLAAQNLQARCRGVIMMAFSNRTGYLVLTTGNRSELAMGYCTIYGDMVGGFAVLKDVPKTLVYELAEYRNQLSLVIPPRTITRAPTAELAPNQKDEDSLPPYAILDPILFAYLNQGQSSEAIIAQGFARSIVLKVINLVRKNEYKRRQAAIGPHLNHRSFGKDWRYPLTNGFKG